MTSDYDWHYNTVEQSELNKTVYWPRGKVVGGSSAVNGLYMIRGSEIEHNSWGSLVNATDLWGWDAIYPYMKSESGGAALEPSFLAAFADLRVGSTQAQFSKPNSLQGLSSTLASVC